MAPTRLCAVALIAASATNAPAAATLLPLWAATMACTAQAPKAAPVSRLAAMVSSQSRSCLPPGESQAEPAETRAPIVTDRPNIFGSVALPVRHTPLDAKWQSVSRSSLAARSGPWAETVRSTHGMGRNAQAQAVNRWVNARVRFTDDGKKDRWSNAKTTIAQRRGDCEDAAIAKMKLLEAAGIPREDLYLVIAYDLARRAEHALLAVRDGGRLLILDNGTDEVRDQSDVPDYRPIVSYSANGAWIHGFARLASAR